MEKQKAIEKLHKEIRKCRKCSLWRTRIKAVPGEGPVNTKIIFLGMAPGRKEDKTGRPFIGRAGQLLNQLLEIAGIDRKKIFITSPLKCLPTPPPNRQPKRKEIAACLPYLLEQIDIINPRKIILLGGMAFSIFFPKQKLGEFRGKWIKKEGRQFFITYHPAAGLRFPKIKKTLQKDFKKLTKLKL